MTPTETVFLRTGTVRLVQPRGDIGPETLGYLVGKFAREEPTYLVSFGSAVVLELRADEIVPAAA
ncbi:MAG TPA: hypothetical protein VM049_08345 [Gaiellaceae bacterium]|nr:hypothetical protein [Gaiellaceae bacterium]